MRDAQRIPRPIRVIPDIFLQGQHTMKTEIPLILWNGANTERAQNQPHGDLYGYMMLERDPSLAVWNTQRRSKSLLTDEADRDSCAVVPDHLHISSVFLSGLARNCVRGAMQ